jgi:hypothetical protein
MHLGALIGGGPAALSSVARRATVIVLLCGMSEYFDNTHLKSSFADLSIPKLLILNAVAVVVKVDGEVIMMVTIWNFFYS